MKIDYHTFEVEPWLKKQQQPTFLLTETTPACKYYTLVNPVGLQHAITTNSSDGIRVPIFALSTSLPESQPKNVELLSHGSLLFAMGLENALQFLDKLQLGKPIKRAMIVIATNCHEISGSRYRAYFGITLEVQTGA